MSKELFISVYEDLVNNLIDQGYSEAEAERIAENGAYDAYRDRVADMTDQARLLKKEGKI